MGGGPSSEQKQAAASQANLTDQLANTASRQEQFFENQQNKVNPFYTSRMNNGLPYYSSLTDAAGGTTAQAFQPARAALARETGGFGPSLPNGFATQANSDLNEQQAQAFDQNLVGAMSANEQAKQAGAAGLI